MQPLHREGDRTAAFLERWERRRVCAQPGIGNDVATLDTQRHDDGPDQVPQIAQHRLEMAGLLHLLDGREKRRQPVLADIAVRAEDRVHGHETLHPVGVPRGDDRTNWTAPILHHERLGVST